MPRPKKSSLPKQKTTLLSFWQPSSVPSKYQAHRRQAVLIRQLSPRSHFCPSGNSIEISDLAKKVACLVPQGLHSGLDALDWSGEPRYRCRYSGYIQSSMRHRHFDDEKYQTFEDATHESLDDKVSIHYRGSEEVVDSDEISAKADLSNGKGRGKSAPTST
ncbi:hypothetical protein MYU51_000543 [Penicillium brevicompactum]